MNPIINEDHSGTRPAATVGDGPIAGPHRDGDDLLASLSRSQQESLSQILEDYLKRLEQGNPVDPEQLAASHPELAEPIRCLLRSLDFVHQAAADLGGSDPTSPQTHDAPGELGEFEIVREIGRGGMGIVYEARQKSLGRRVALKVLPFAAVLDQRQILRFKNEAQAAAQLHHPHIVPVHSVGCDRGVHHYSMQFIEGQSLGQAISELAGLRDDFGGQETGSLKSTQDRTAFSTRRSIRCQGHVMASAELIRQAADALQHAHEFGVVHRDIKPSNLLIDQKGKLWVTDFGLARCQDSTTMTMTGDLLGTIRYMSPEAASGRGSLVDHVSDVYSLGVTLYELLTLRPPHESSHRSELLEQIQVQQPVSPRQHNPAIPVDLETIVLKSIEKSRDDRYRSAAAMEADLQRFLAGDAPLAKRPSWLDRAARWAQRHRKLVASLGSAVLALTLFSAIAAAMLSAEKRKTEAALKTAESNFRQSQSNLQQAIDVVDRFGMRLADKLANVPGAQAVRQQIMAETLADYQAFAQQMQGDVSMRFAQALCYTQMASMHRQLGQLSEAEDCYRSAAGLYEQVLDDPEGLDSSDASRVKHDLAVCFNNLGELAFQHGDLQLANTEYTRSIRMTNALLQSSADRQDYQQLLSATLVNEGNLHRVSGRIEQARRSSEQAVELQQKLCQSDPDDPKRQRELAVSYAQLSFLCAEDNLQLADEYNRRAIEVHRRLTEERPNDLAALSDLATCYNHRGAIFNRGGKIVDALAAYGDAVEIQEQLVLRAPTMVRYQEQLAVGHNNLGQVLTSQSPGSDAGRLHFQRAKDLLSELVDQSPQSPHYRAQLGGVLANMAPLVQTTEPDVARQQFEQAIELQERALERSPGNENFRVWLSTSYVKYGKFLRNAGDYEQAGEVAIKRRQIWRDQPQRLYRVSVELAQAASGVDQSRRSEKRRLKQETLATWSAAVKLGLTLKQSDVIAPELKQILEESGQTTMGMR